ncbi:hypothetical protein GCM10012284_23490 [Mangrovihabitans endophyticus]|uniref:Vegetative cell wall protein gp1 n=2 Tax=Mangrovihabitans endophyticus TaxID=1751298 RepID=A0A8J3FN38_9ACTN|nr:hypothetical protein GCM10012284_23490 [Mangrovihabitans endophyticus]
MLVVPGVVYLVAVFVAARLGHRRWFDLGSLRADVTHPVWRDPGTAVLLLALILAGAAAVGVLVQGLGALFVRVWLMPAVGPAVPLAARRARAWDRADAEFRSALVAAGRAQLAASADAADLRRTASALAARRDRTALARPQRPFWMGDRIAATDTRVHEKYLLDLASAWPRLWLVVPEPVRAEFGHARSALTRQSCLAGWALAYATLGVRWWPALVIGAVCGVTAWTRARAAVGVLADLVESAVDVHGRTLAASLGVSCEGVLTKETGAQITAITRADP